MAKMKKFRSLFDLHQRCQNGDEDAQRVCVGALQNIGSEHLASNRGTKWERAYDGLRQYLFSLVAEYGQPEDAAESQLLDEINNVIGCCDDVMLDEKR